MVTRLNINRSVLSYYIEKSAIPLDTLQSKIKNLESFLSGSKQPTFNQLSEIARIIDVPTGLLLLSDTVDSNKKMLKFRTVNSDEVEEISNGLRDTITEMQTKQDFLKNEINYKLNFIGKFSIEDNYLEVADNIRKQVNIPTNYQKKAGPNAVNYFRSKISQIGIFVFFNGSVKNNTHKSLSVNEFRGFVLPDKKAPIIFVNQKDSKTGQLFTLVHELVHLFINKKEIFNIIDTGTYKFNRTEAFVNKITAELLMPNSEIKKLNNYDFEFLANEFPVSKFVVLRRLYVLGRLTKQEYKEKFLQLENKLKRIPQKRKSTGGSYPNNLKFRFDKTFVHYVENALKQNKITYTDAFNITGVSYKGYKILTGGNMQ